MICLPCSCRDSLGCGNCIGSSLDGASPVGPITSNLGRLTAKQQCHVSPLLALSARHDHCSGDASSASCSVASFGCQSRDCSRHVGFSCGTSLHARHDDFLTVGSASQSDKNSDVEASFDYVVSGLSSAQKKSGSISEAQATKDNVSAEFSFASAAGSSKSRLSLPYSLSIQESHQIINNTSRQIPLSLSNVLMADFSHRESDTRLHEVTLETNIAKVACIQSSETMQGRFEPSADSANLSESNSVIGVSHFHLREEHAEKWSKEDQGGSMSPRMYARVESDVLENGHEPHGSSNHAQDICIPQSFSRCHGGYSSADHLVALKEMNLVRKEPANDTDNMSIVRLPSYRTSSDGNRSLQLTESILYLDSLGVNSNRLIQEEPRAMTYNIKRLRELVRALEGLGLHWKDIGKSFNLCPRIIHLCPVKDIKLVTDFLFNEVGLLPKDLSKVIKRCPRLLACDVVKELSPTLLFLRTLDFSNMGHVVANNATLLSLDVEKKLKPKLEYLESLGFTNREVVSMVNRFPALFNYNIKENLEPKYEYLVQEMGGSNRDLLAFPQYFGYSLARRIMPRYECITKQDVSLSIEAMLKLSEAEFTTRFESVSDLVTS